MVFSSSVFLWIFLPLVYVINLILPKRFSNVFLLVASVLFYAWGEPVYVLLMLLTIVINWGVGIALSKVSSEKSRKAILTAGVLADIFILGFFKYSDFIVNTINGVIRRQLLTSPGVALPIGISFFTFQAISYCVDVYRNDTKASKNFINVALYISFFPQLIAGPIVKYKEINEQICDRSINAGDTAEGFRRFIYGLGKKVIVSNILGKSVDLIFDLSMESVGVGLAWLGAVMYSLQIYYDFSGYSDMAIGLGKMFGFTIPENFNLPYLSKSVAEFWRRWHISLGTWFREYVYIPLGGNRKGSKRTIINLLIVFALTGAWHGASFSFIFWGLWHGFFSIVERLFLGAKLEGSKIISRIYLLVVAICGWVIFRINNLPRALSWLGRMFFVGAKNTSVKNVGWYLSSISWCVLAAAIMGCGVIQSVVPIDYKEKWKNSILEAVYCVVILIISLALVASDTYNPFIYFNF